mgnify:FL=1
MTSPNPDAVFASLHQQAAGLCGARLFTVTVLDRAAGLARRAYTSHPADYPTSGTKPMRNDGWTDLVLGEKRSFVANSTPEFAIYFSDHAQINALGCESAMNIPVTNDAGIVVACVNVLDAAGHFTPERIATLEGLVARNRPALLAAIAGVPMDPAS